MAVLQNVLSQIGQYRNKTPFQDAFKARQMGAQLGNEQFRLPAVREAIAGGNYKDMRQAYAQYDPSIIKNMTDPKKLSVFEQRLQRLQTPEAVAVLDEYEKVSDEMAQLIDENPLANITSYVSKLGNLERRYKEITGSPMPTRLTTASLQSAKTERTEAEKDLDETYQAIKDVTDKTLTRLDTDLRLFAGNAPSLRKAINLLNDKPLTPIKINTAMKSYVQGIDNSAVMEGEIKAIAGESFLGEIRAFINKLTSGQSMSKKQVDDLWGAIKIIAKTTDDAIDSLTATVVDEARSRLNQAVSTKRIDANDLPMYLKDISNIAKSRLNRFKVGKMVDGALSYGTGPEMEDFINLNMTTTDDTRSGRRPFGRPANKPPRPEKKDFKDVRAYELALEQWEIKYGD